MPDVGGCEGKTELWCCSLVCPTTPILVTMVRDFPGGTRVAGTTGPRCDPPNLRQPTSLRSTHPTPTPCNPQKYEKYVNKIYFIKNWSSQPEAGSISSIHPGSNPSHIWGFFQGPFFWGIVLASLWDCYGRISKNSSNFFLEDFIGRWSQEMNFCQICTGQFVKSTKNIF